MNENKLEENYGTLSETINELAKLGYTHDFNIKDDCIVCHNNNIELSPADFQIDKAYRFEGASDPEYQSILYAISSINFKVKGVLVNGYGISSDEASSRIVEKLNTHKLNDIFEKKINDATHKRPDGERILNASLVEINLNESIKQIISERTWAESERNAVTIFKSDTMRIVLIGLRKNAALKSHKTNGILSIQVLEGKIEFTAEHRCSQIGKGQIIALQENIIHSVIALTESFILLTIAMNKN